MTKKHTNKFWTGILLAIVLMYSCSALNKKSTIVGKEFKTETGLIYKITQEVTGKRAQAGDKVEVHYTGKLKNDSIFDSSLFRNQPFSFKLGEGQVIKGWDEGIALLKVGEKARLIIPQELGYGERGYPPIIPAKATLIFDVELVDVK